MEIPWIQAAPTAHEAVTFAAEVIDLKSKVTDIGKQMSSLQSTLAVFAPVDSVRTGSLPNGDTKGISSTKKSYACAVGLNEGLAKVVKSVVADSFKNQRIQDRDKASLVIHGVAETRNDLGTVRDFLKPIDCAESVLRVYRLGKEPAQNRVRPVKVELKSKSDRDHVLRQIKTVLKNVKGAKVFITKYLNTEELAKLKDNRNKCEKLNKAAPKCQDGRDRFIVINNRIMRRLDNGGLANVSADTAAAEGSSSSQSVGSSSDQSMTHREGTKSKPKKGKGGSQETPAH